MPFYCPLSRSPYCSLWNNFSPFLCQATSQIRKVYHLWLLIGLVLYVTPDQALWLEIIALYKSTDLWAILMTPNGHKQQSLVFTISPGEEKSIDIIGGSAASTDSNHLLILVPRSLLNSLNINKNKHLIWYCMQLKFSATWLEDKTPSGWLQN